MQYTVGSYLAARLAQIDLKHHFAVAGDFNLVLLDQILTNKDLEQVYCCNELNCGYSAEGYARACGAAAAVVTFSVGGLSAINAIASASAIGDSDLRCTQHERSGDGAPAAPRLRRTIFRISWNFPRRRIPRGGAQQISIRKRRSAGPLQLR